MSFDARGLALEIRADALARLDQVSAEVRGKILPRLEEVSNLLAGILLERLARGGQGEPSELERALMTRFRLLSAAIELHAVDAFQDTVERTVGRLVRAGFAFLLTTF